MTCAQLHSQDRFARERGEVKGVPEEDDGVLARQRLRESYSAPGSPLSGERVRDWILRR